MMVHHVLYPSAQIKPFLSFLLANSFATSIRKVTNKMCDPKIRLWTHGPKFRAVCYGFSVENFPILVETNKQTNNKQANVVVKVRVAVVHEEGTGKTSVGINPLAGLGLPNPLSCSEAPSFLIGSFAAHKLLCLPVWFSICCLSF